MQNLNLDSEASIAARARQNREALQIGALQTITRIERRKDEIAAIDARFAAAVRERKPDPFTRAYKVASLDRLNANWPLTHISINRELRQSLRNIRNRIRILAQNDDYIKRYLELEMNNGPGWEGYTPLLSMSDWDPTSDDPVPPRDLKILKEIEDAWKEWCRTENCSVSGKMSHTDQARLFRRTRKRDGEVLVRKVIADNAFGFALQFIDVAWLDEYYNEALPNGNRIIMSVEMDQYGKPLAYWLTMPPSEYLFGGRPQGTPFRQRVEASQFIHAFVVLDGDDQARGVPEPHTAALTLKVLDEFDYADLVGSYVEQCQLPYLVPPKDEDEDAGPSQSTATDANGLQIAQPIERQVEPAIQTILPPGWDVKSFTPRRRRYGQSLFLFRQRFI
jgi:lambda family phage portal protein